MLATAEEDLQEEDLDLKEERGHKMIDYKIVKFCKWCRDRFLVKKGESTIYLCPKCSKKNNKEVKK